MRWKRLAWVGCLAPAVTGCHVALDAGAGHGPGAVDRAIRRDARDGWAEVGRQFPRRAFTPEFRDGFLDGYADHLDRGGAPGPAVAPPPHYADQPRYFTPDGQVLLRHYLLGFRYGAEVAAASGKRAHYTVPVLLPEAGLAAVDSPAAAAPPPAPRSLPAEPKPTAADRGPVARQPVWVTPPKADTPPAGPLPDVGPSKFPVAVAPEGPEPKPAATLLPPPAPLVPSPADRVNAPAVKLPDPPAEVPTGQPLPLFDRQPTLPPNLTVVPPLPPALPDPK